MLYRRICPHYKFKYEERADSPQQERLERIESPIPHERQYALEGECRYYKADKLFFRVH